MDVVEHKPRFPTTLKSVTASRSEWKSTSERNDGDLITFYVLSNSLDLMSSGYLRGVNFQCPSYSEWVKDKCTAHSLLIISRGCRLFIHLFLIIETRRYGCLERSGWIDKVVTSPRISPFSSKRKLMGGRLNYKAHVELSSLCKEPRLPKAFHHATLLLFDLQTFFKPPLSCAGRFQHFHISLKPHRAFYTLPTATHHTMGSIFIDLARWGFASCLVWFGLIVLWSVKWGVVRRSEV